MDELDRVRQLTDDVPAPDPAAKADARAQLLAQAEEERAADAGGDRSGAWSVLRRLAGGLPRPALATAVVLVAALAVAGVVYGPLRDGPAGRDVARPDDPAPSEEVRLASRCTSPAYTVGYPEGWHTNTGDATTPCTSFATTPLDIEPGTGGGAHGAVRLDVEDVPFERAAGADGHFRRVLRREETTVAGRPALRLVEESTGGGLYPDGHRVARYLVDLDGRTLIAEAHDGDDPPFRQRVDVLEDMMATIDLTTGS